MIQAAERRVRELELELESARRQEDARRTREVKGAEPSSGDALHLGEPENAEKHVSTFREPEPRDSSRADRTAEAAATPAYPVATPAPTPRARLVPNPGAFLEPKLAEPKSEPRDSHVAGPERKTESAAAFVRAPEPEPERSVAERDAPKDASEPPSAVSARLLLEAQTQAQALLEAQTQALLQAQAQALLQVKAQAQAQQLLLQPPAAAQPVFPPSVERESLSLRAPESQSESRLSSARRAPALGVRVFPAAGLGRGHAPAASQPRTRGLRPRRGRADNRKARGGRRRRKAGEARRFCFVAVRFPRGVRLLGGERAVVSRRGGPGPPRGAPRRLGGAEREPRRALPRGGRLETPGTRDAAELVSRDPRAFFGGSPSHGADSASAFGAVVATLESAKKLMVGAEVSSLTAGSPSALLPSRARGGATPGARARARAGPRGGGGGAGRESFRREGRVSSQRGDRRGGGPGPRPWLPSRAAVGGGGRPGDTIRVLHRVPRRRRILIRLRRETRRRAGRSLI